MNFIKNKDIIRGGQLTLLKIEAYDNVYVFYIQEPGAEVEKYSFNILNYADRKNKDYNLMFIEKALKHIIKTYEEGQAKYILEDTTRRFEIAFEITNIRGSENKLLQMDIDISKLGSTRVKAYQPEIELVKERRQGTGQGDMAMRLDMDKMFNSYEFRAMMHDYKMGFYRKLEISGDSRYYHYYIHNQDRNILHIYNNQSRFSDIVGFLYSGLGLDRQTALIRVLTDYGRNNSILSYIPINSEILHRMYINNLIDNIFCIYQGFNKILTISNQEEFDVPRETDYKIFDILIHIYKSNKYIKYNVDYSNNYYEMKYEGYNPKYRVIKLNNMDECLDKIKNIYLKKNYITQSSQMLEISIDLLFNNLEYFIYEKKLYKNIKILQSKYVTRNYFIKHETYGYMWEGEMTEDPSIYILCEEI